MDMREMINLVDTNLNKEINDLLMEEHALNEKNLLKSFAAAGAMAMALGGAHASAQDLGQYDASQPYNLPQDREACQAQPNLAWCSKHDAQQNEHNLSIDQIKKIDQQARAHFIADDNKNITAKTTWRSHADDTKTWYGFCNDLTYTALDIASRQGQPSKSIWRLLVTTERAASEGDHQVGVLQADDGSLWIVGDSESFGAYPMKKMQYKKFVQSNASDPDEWYKSK